MRPYEVQAALATDGWDVHQAESWSHDASVDEWAEGLAANTPHYEQESRKSGGAAVRGEQASIGK